MYRFFGKLTRNRYLFVFLAPFALFAPVILTGKTLFWGTQITQFIPWWEQAVEIIKAGELPLWNPLNGMGAPLLANYQSALLYPPTWLLLVLDMIGGAAWMAWGLALVLGLHLAWAGVGMVRLVKTLGWGVLAQTVSGLSFAMSGYLVARSHFPSIVFAAAWFPWILGAVYKLVLASDSPRHALQLGIFLGLLLLAGHAQTAWHILLFSGVWLLFWTWFGETNPPKRRVLYMFTAAVLLGVFLASVQLLPTLEYLLESQRASEVDFEFAVAYSFWPWRFITLLIPNLFGSPAAGNYAGYAAYWEDAVYIGLIPILLAAKTVFSKVLDKTDRRLKWFLISAISVSFLLALGKNTPIFPWLYQHIPGFDMFQAPTRFSVWAVFSLSLLAGMGANAWNRPRGRGLYWSRLAVAGAAAIAVGAGLVTLLQRLDGVSLPDIPTTYIPAFAMLGFWCLIAAVLNLFAPIESDARDNSPWMYAVLIVITLDLLSIGWGLNPGVDASLYQSDPEYAFVPDSKSTKGKRIYLSSEEERVLKFERFFSFQTFELDEDWINIRSTLLPNTNLLDGIASANNFDPLLPDRFDAWMEALEKANPPAKEAMLARMAVAWVEHPHPGYPNGIRVDAIESANRIRWVPCAWDAENEYQAMQTIQESRLDPDEYVVLIKSVPEGNVSCDRGAVGTIETIKASNNHLVVRGNARQEGWLVVSDVWYPGWQATIDGQPADILIADTLFRAVAVPAGEHTIEFHYRPWPFYAGAFLSFVAWVSCLWAWERKA